MNAVTATVVPFDHRQSAHCESGVISSLLRHNGLDVSEPMAFGISAGLGYAYLPFLKFGGLPLFAYRMPPGWIIRGLTKRLGIKMHMQTFRRPEDGTRALDAHLAAGRAVGIQTSAYWLSYFPPDMRFHFNAHNLVVYGKRGDQYLISDPVIDILVECEEAALQKARFTRGIRLVARKIRKLDPRQEAHNKLLLGHIVRMQEEIGTGGAGFRFLYASFLQEAAALLDKPKLAALADRLTEVGDEWRRFALHAAKMCKGRMDMDYGMLADQLLHCAAEEDTIYRELRAEVK